MPYSSSACASGRSAKLVMPHALRCRGKVAAAGADRPHLGHGGQKGRTAPALSLSPREETATRGTSGAESQDQPKHRPAA
jgi:hypothetical protein